jgi:hypothetical protein
MHLLNHTNKIPTNMKYIKKEQKKNKIKKDSRKKYVKKNTIQ